MNFSSPPLEGVVIIVIDELPIAHQIERGLSNAGATVFVADGEVACRTVLSQVQPHFAVIDPTCAGGTGPQSLAWTLFSHPECRTIVYSTNFFPHPTMKTRWLITKDRSVSDVVEAVLSSVRDPSQAAQERSP